MVLRVKPKPTRFLTSTLYAPMDNITLVFYIKFVPPVGRLPSSYLYTGIARPISFNYFGKI